MFGLKKNLGYLHSVKWGAASIGTSFLRQLLLVPVFISALGNDGYGAWLLLFSAASFINAFGSGFLHYSCNIINISYHAGNNIKALVSNIIKAIVQIVVLQAVLGLALSSVQLLSVFVNLDVHYLATHNASSAFLFLLGARLFYQYNLGFVLRMFEPSGHIKDTLKFQFFTDFIDLIATAVLVYATQNLLHSCIGIFAVNALLLVISVIYVQRRTGFFSLRAATAGSSGLIKKSFGLNAGFFIEKVYDSWLNLLVSHFFGPALVPVFNVTQKLVNVFYRLSYMLVQPLFPDIQKQFGLRNFAFVSQLIVRHWRILLSVIMASVTVSIPFLPWFYKRLTGNALAFDLSLLLFLFMGILLQNFIFIIGEFFKKTNFSRQFMIFSVLRVGSTISLMWVFSVVGYTPGIGASMALAELICVVYALYIFTNKVVVIRQMYYYLGFVICFCALLLLYMVTRSYMLLLLPAMAQLALMLYLNREKKIL